MSLINNNIYGSYYNALLTGVNSPYGKSKMKFGAAGNTSTQSLFQSFNSFSGIDYQGASSLWGVKTDAKQLQGIVSKLESAATFTKKGAASSNTEALAVKGSAAYKSNTPDIKVSIEQVATGQVNEGAALQSSTRIASGSHTFDIVSGGVGHRFTVETKPGETQLDLQNRMASEINAKNIGVKASVVKDEEKGVSSLKLESSSTGAQSSTSFAIRDVTGSAVSKTGVANVTQTAQDARYTVDGVQKTSKSNTVNLGGGITGELKKATKEDITVSMKADGTHAANMIGELVESFNSLLDKAELTDSARLQRDLSGVSKTYARSLSRLGIQVDSKGYMSIDSEKLAASAKDGSLEKSFTEFRNMSYGFSQRLSRVAGNAASNPASYTRSATFNPFYGTGLFFNMMV